MEKVLMYNPWTRDDTKDFIHRVETRIEDIDYYLKRTQEWCEHNGIFENKKVLICCLITCIWVSSMRQELITFQEILEYVGVKDLEDSGLDKIYNVCEEFRYMDHDEILNLLITKTNNLNDYLP